MSLVLRPYGDAGQAHRIYADLVAGGAALGWLAPPAPDEVAALLARVDAAVDNGDGAIRYAYLDGALVGLGYWLRYERPTHRPNADVNKVAVAPSAQGRGVGRAVMAALIDAAREAGLEKLTLDVRGDNAGAQHLYRSLGFVEYGRLPGFVAVGPARYDKVCFYLPLT